LFIVNQVTFSVHLKFISDHSYISLLVASLLLFGYYM